MKPIATVINNNQPGWTNIIEIEPNVTLSVGTRLYLADPVVPLGSPLGGGFLGGIGYAPDGPYALIFAPKAEGEKMNLLYKIRDLYTSDGTNSDVDGFANSELINDDNHPAAQYCRSLRIGGVDDWSLPSRDELAMGERNLGPNRKNTPEPFRAGGVEAFEECWYWSSTERASNSSYAWVVDFDGGGQGTTNKSYYCGVRAVRRLKL
ncbi:MAG: DUF1566 domain-containing protein [Bacteroidetes bacterium]|nr:MAG: DUF1566 domain-containing protein [Bacteroidota bacterium]